MLGRWRERAYEDDVRELRQRKCTDNGVRLAGSEGKCRRRWRVRAKSEREKKRASWMRGKVSEICRAAIYISEFIKISVAAGNVCFRRA